MGVRIVLDREKCQGHGLCAMYAPDSFALDADIGVAEVLPDGALRSSRETLDLAEQMCPVHAIRIVQDAAAPED